MCGIAGFWGGRLSNDQGEDLLSRMGTAIASRGPDGAGVWFDNKAQLGLSHRRLAILDLSEAGSQPMMSASGRYMMVFNGEIYNHIELRAEIERRSNGGISWVGHSDTETLLAGFEAFGFEATLCRSVGMFAIALWDCELRTLTLARDRMGEKPLYYGLQAGVLLFGSQLKALRAHPAFCAKLDRGSLSLYLRHNYVPSPYSIYEGIFKLPAGTWLQLNEDVLKGGRLTNPAPYWTLQNAIAKGKNNPFIGDEKDAINGLEHRLLEAVRLQQLADVPLGAFLSGGVDSSTIVALMQSQSMRPVKTFTIGFYEEGFNEALHAELVARHLGTDHTELYVSPQQALQIIPKLPLIYDEPFADPSQIPTFLIAEMARKHVTVALSGDGGDEIFGGYNRYLLISSVWRKLSMMPQPLRQLMAEIITTPSPQTWSALYRTVFKFLPARFQVELLGDKLHKLAEIMTAKSPQDVYRRLISRWKDPALIVLQGWEPSATLSQYDGLSQTTDFEHWMMAVDTLTYLADDILVKVDRAAMAMSLETRVPFLDHRIVEFAWQIPLSMKIRDGKGKWLLRQLLYRHVPKELIERPKMGFGVPIGSWLRGPLRDWASSLLDEVRLRKEGYFDPVPIQRMWKEHLSCQGNWQYYLWNILMFQAWLEQENL